MNSPTISALGFSPGFISYSAEGDLSFDGAHLASPKPILLRPYFSSCWVRLFVISQNIDESWTLSAMLCARCFSG